MGLKPHRRELANRLGWLHRGAQVMLLGILVGYWVVQIAEGARYRELADNNRLRKLAIEAPRGRIFDRQGRVLAENVPSYSLMLDRSLSRDLDASLAFAGAVLGTTREALAEKAAAHRGVSRFRQLRIGDQLTLRQVARIGVEHLEHPEFDVAVEHRRLYRHAHQTAHVLGYLREATGTDLEKPGYRSGDLIGKKGIERLYESRLRGTRGEQVVVVDSRGRLVDELNRIDARSGDDVRLTLDLDLQSAAARLLEDKTGAIVALDPRQGEILAMAASPSFDPNLFARRMSAHDWQELNRNPKHPFQNRAVQNAYAPGSVFKIVMALAGLEEGVIEADQPRVHCRGSIQLYDRRWRCWLAPGHGIVDLEGSLRGSCDIYYYLLGKKLGVDTIARYARSLGLGQATGFELGEKNGLVPTSEWKKRVRGVPWYPGETISLAIGQGPILATPLQIAVMMGTVARGERVRPHLVFEDPRRDPLPYREENLELIRHALVSVIQHPRGTGRVARLNGITMAGKTGTAQVVAQDTWTHNEDLPPEQRDHAWFASYAPAEDPELVIVVFVEHGGGGSTAAAPLAKALYEIYFDHRGAA